MLARMSVHRMAIRARQVGPNDMMKRLNFAVRVGWLNGQIKPENSTHRRPEILLIHGGFAPRDGSDLEGLVAP